MKEKDQQFLILVQTMFLAHCINVPAEDKEGQQHRYSMSGAYSLMSEALDACERIPANLSAQDAANSFGEFMILEKGKIPSWLQRP